MEGRLVEIGPEGANVADPEEYANELFQFALANFIPDVPSTTYVGIAIESTASVIDIPLYVGLRKRNELN